jgi:hypothetical protein
MAATSPALTGSESAKRGREFRKTRNSLRIVGHQWICEFRHTYGGLIPAGNVRGRPTPVRGIRECDHMGMTSQVVDELDRDDREYDQLLNTLTQVSARLDVLQTAVGELCQLCEKDDVHGEQVLELLQKHGAVSKAAHARFHAA